MKLVLKLLLLLMFVTGCKTKHLQIEKKEEVQKEVRKTKRDSVFDIKMEAKTAMFSLDQMQSVELELETEQDSTGNSKELHFVRYRDGPVEKISVIGGKVRLKLTDNKSENIVNIHNKTDQKSNIQTQEIQRHETKKQLTQKHKIVKQTRFSLFFYLWTIVLLIALFIAWKYKLWRWLSIFWKKFKQLLKIV